MEELLISMKWFHKSWGFRGHFLGELLVSITWFWECWISRTLFGRVIGINDMVSGAAKWSELCEAKTPMMQRKGDKSQGAIAFTNTHRDDTYMLSKISQRQRMYGFTNTQRQHTHASKNMQRQHIQPVTTTQRQHIYGSKNTQRQHIQPDTNTQRQHIHASKTHRNNTFILLQAHKDNTHIHVQHSLRKQV